MINDIPVPGNCVVCGLNVFQTTIKRMLKSWKTGRQKWWCQHCNSWFSWESTDRIVGEIETQFSHGVLGNVDIESINKGMGNKYIDGKLPDEFDPPHYKHERNFE